MQNNKFFEKVFRSKVIPVNEDPSQEELLTAAKKYSDEGNIFKSVVALAVMYQRADRKDYAMQLSAQILGVTGYLSTKKIIPDLIGSLWHRIQNPRQRFFYFEVLETCICYPMSLAASISCIIAKSEILDFSQLPEKAAFLKKLDFFAPTTFDEFTDWTMFIDRLPKSFATKPELRKKAIDIIFKQIIQQSNAQQWILTLWMIGKESNDSILIESAMHFALVIEMDLESVYASRIKDNESVEYKKWTCASIQRSKKETNYEYLTKRKRFKKDFKKNLRACLSNKELATLLETAFSYGTLKQVVMVYNLLARKDRNLALPYHDEVLRHALLLNKNLKESGNKYRLTSPIWGLPVHLENPANRTARNAS